MEGENKKQGGKDQQRIKTMQKDIARMKGLQTQESGTVAEPEEEKIEIDKIRELSRKKAEEKKKAEAQKEITEAQKAEKEEGIKAEAAAESEKAKGEEEEKEKKEEEERKLTEEERRKRVAEEEERIRKDRFLAKKAEEQKMAEIDKEIENLELKKKEINSGKKRFLAEIKNFEVRLEPLRREELVVESEIHEVEDLEKKASAEKRGQIEKKRWEIDIRRREMEKAKWQILEEIEKVEEKIKEVDLRVQETTDQQDQLKTEKERILLRRREEELIKEKARLKNEISQLDEENKIIEGRENEASIRENELETELAQTLKEEKITEDVIQEMERKEKQISDPKEQRKVEKERWKVEDDRKSMEKKRWDLEREKGDVSSSLKEIKLQHQEITEKKNLLEIRLREINQQLRISSEEPEKEEASSPERAPVERERGDESKDSSSRFAEARVKEESVETVEKTTPPAEKKTAAQSQESEEEKEERRRIIKEEMKKRIAQATAERNREGVPYRENTPPQTEEQEEAETEAPLYEGNEAKNETSEDFVSVVPEKPSSFEKISVRLAVVAIILLIGGFFYWLFFVRGKTETVVEPLAPAEEVIETEIPEIETPPIAEIPELVIPASLIQIEETLTVKIADRSEIPAFIPQLLEDDFGEANHVRILFENETENKIVGLRDFLETLEVVTPEGLLDGLSDDFTLFIYTKENETRLGFIARIEGADIESEENLAALARSWEKTMVNDTEKLFEALGKEKTDAILSFKDASYKDVPFRYLSFPQGNFGICWAIYENKFLFTSSGESIMRSIDKLII